MKRFLPLIALCAAFPSDAAEPSGLIKLEHTFDGYYSPYNFPVVMPQEDEKYFYESMPVFDETTGFFSAKTYNEDYTLRSDIHVKLQDLPSQYSVTSVSYSPYYSLPDGTPIICVSLRLKDGTLGASNYATACLYNADNGKQLCNFGYAGQHVTPLLMTYNINGKLSILVMLTDYDKATFTSHTYTKVYSLGDILSSEIETSIVNAPTTYPVECFDVRGHSISNPPAHAPGVVIIRNSDGSTEKVLGR